MKSLPSERPLKRLQDIVENCDRIMHYTNGLRAQTYAPNTITVDAVERCLQRISEAAMKLGDYLDEAYPDVPWKKMRAMGNILRHRYEEVMAEITWQTATVEVPRFRTCALLEIERLSRS
jgi:uncharacterized protein with HEPN domain